jgi:two-component system, chemotaxis family, sensor kinase Cph1
MCALSESQPLLGDAASLQTALAVCAQEPIHIPGTIQPHGLMLVLDPDTLTITQISANCIAITGMPVNTLLGQSVQHLFTKSHRSALHTLKNGTPRTHVHAGTITLLETQYDIVAHATEAGIIAELEPTGSTPHEIFLNALQTLSQSLRTLTELPVLFQSIVDQVRQLSNFDRVMLYKFDPDYHGCVVAESRVTDIGSHLGLHFPASDIPQQARDLYVRNPLRLIRDNRALPVPMITLPGLSPRSRNNSPLDMSDALLRSVSPIHLQYLENMGVRASMSISILQDSHLWGLLACHHRTPRHVPYHLRVAAELMGHLFAAQLFTIGAHQRQKHRELRDTLLTDISHLVRPGCRFEEAFDSFPGLAARALNADGIVLALNGGLHKYGHVPSDAIIHHLVGWLTEHSPGAVWHSRDTNRDIPHKIFADGQPDTHQGGLLAVPLGSMNADFILWFRQPVQRTLDWAGHPHKELVATAHGYRLSPRASFATWREVVGRDAAAWDKDDLDAANRILQIILEAAKFEAEAANAAKSDFLARMSHELRTPMNAILGLVSILEMGQADPRQREYLRTLRLSSNTLLNVINDLLDISKIEAREFHLEEQPLSLTALAGDVLQLVQIQASEKHLRLSAELPVGDALWCRGDPHRLRQILINLLSNAIKFTTTGSVLLRIHREHGTTENSDRFVITVKDSGIGIPVDKLDMIFERFIQADSSITRHYGGTGLGLTICKHLVTLMQGTIQVDSAPGQGSTFTVILPLPAADDAPEATYVPAAITCPPAVHHPAQRILLVEDYEANILVAVTLLHTMGYTVDVARTGLEALELMEQQCYDAVLMDVQMPGLDGLEVTRRLRQREQQQGLPHLQVIGMTAHALTGDREHCLQAGMDDYLAKPFQIAELEQKLRQNMG